MDATDLDRPRDDSCDMSLFLRGELEGDRVASRDTGELLRPRGGGEREYLERCRGIESLFLRGEGERLPPRDRGEGDREPYLPP